MDTIRKVRIKNYRGLNDIDFSPRSVNIIIGPNNTGKSSILESIGLTISSLNNFEDILETNLLDVLTVDKEYKPKYLISSGEKHCEINLEISTDGKDIINLQLMMDIFEKGYPDNEIGLLFFEYVNEYIEKFINTRLSRKDRVLQRKISDFDKNIQSIESEKRLKILLDISKSEKEKTEKDAEKIREVLYSSGKLFLSSKENNDLINVSVVQLGMESDFKPFQYEFEPLEDATVYHDENLAKKLDIPIVFNFHTIGYSEDIFDLYKRLVQANKIDIALESVKKRIHYLKDIREGTDNGLTILQEKKEPLPMSLMGDGFNALLRLTFIATLVSRGIILLEEPEINLHPYYLEILAEEIMRNSKRSQFFISTHSIELLNYIFNKAEELGSLESINILRLIKSPDGFIEREVISGTNAKKEIEEIKSDLRRS
jgi:predicted ATP-dependent endonuclease of OLD family